MTTDSIKIDAKALQIIAAFAFGVIFVTAILILVVSIKNITPPQMWVFKVVLSLAAGGVGAVLPGFIVVSPAKWLRAGGALAVFLLVFWSQPKVVDAITPPYKPSTSGKPTAESWLKLVDEGKFEESFHLTANIFKQAYPYSQYLELLSPTRHELGEVESRIFVSTSVAESPPGAPKGFYSLFSFRSKFSNRSGYVYENITLVGEEETQGWAVYGFNYMTRNTDGAFVPFERGL